jgi:Na+-translocating ferredoxin:NAD+ oxidoreductase RnfG subunit
MEPQNENDCCSGCGACNCSPECISGCKRAAAIIIGLLIGAAISGALIGLLYYVTKGGAEEDIYAKYKIDHRHLIKCILDETVSSDLLDVVYQCLVNLTNS